MLARDSQSEPPLLYRTNPRDSQDRSPRGPAAPEGVIGAKGIQCLLPPSTLIGALIGAR